MLLHQAPLSRQFSSASAAAAAQYYSFTRSAYGLSHVVLYYWTVPSRMNEVQ